MATRNLTIMFTDIKGFTKRVSDSTRKDLNRLLETHERLLRPVFAHFNGIIVKTIGDAFLARFDSPTDAVMCGVAIQKILDEYNKNVGELDQINVRVAINSGDVELIDGDVMGEAVNIAARLEGFAEAGQVYFTEAVYLSMNRTEAPSAEVGEQLFKGIPYPVRVFRVLLDRDFHLDLDAIRRAKPQSGSASAATANGDNVRKGGVPGYVWAVLAVVLGLVAVWIVPRLAPDNQGQVQVSLQQVPERSALEQLEQTGQHMPIDELLALAMPLLSQADYAAHSEQVKQRVSERVLQHVYGVSEREGAKAADDWLNQVAQTYAGIDQVSTELQTAVQNVRLDARIATWQQQGDVPFDAVKQLVSEFQAADVPFRVAQQLRAQLPITMRAEMYDLSLQRGMTLDAAIFEDLAPALLRVVPGQNNRGAHAVLLKYFPEQAESWAWEQMQSVAAPGILHGFEMLQQQAPARVSDAYYQAIYQLAGGYTNDAQAAEALALFSALEDQQQRDQVMGMHRWLIEPKQGVSRWTYRGLQHVRANYAALQALNGYDPFESL